MNSIQSRLAQIKALAERAENWGWAHDMAELYKTIPALVAALEIAVGALNRYEPVLRKFGCTPWGDHDDPSWCDEECNDSGKGLRKALKQIGAALGIEEGKPCK